MHASQEGRCGAAVLPCPAHNADRWRLTAVASPRGIPLTQLVLAVSVPCRRPLRPQPRVWTHREGLWLAWAHTDACW